MGISMRRFVNRPIFIGGWPRGGTRMIADLVASHPHIITSDEVPRRMVSAAISLMETADSSIRRKRHRGNYWSNIREDFFLNIIVNTYRPGIGVSHRVPSRFSNKTPFIEWFFDKIIDICATESPVFIYCVRHPKKVITSLKNMPWNTRSTDANLKLLMKSFHSFQEMKARGVSVKVVQLDKVTSCHDARLNFTKSVFDFLEEAMEDSILSFVERWPIAQPTSRVLKEKTPTVLDEREEQLLYVSPNYKQLCDAFGYDA
jgi:Sulfotransferase family